ncbi:MAG: hypothetical protein Q8N18_03240 [Opitutaceae bacterium]|nr:hypothetical protein [Opitutaceae bacterium]
MTPNWLLLLRALPAYPKIARERLTVAFYLGGSRNPSEIQKLSAKDARLELSRLITSFVDDAPFEHAVRIFRCGSIKQPVVELVNARSAGHSQHALESKVQKRCSLVVDPELAPAGMLSISSLTERLLEELEDDVRSNRFSFEGGRYREFSPQERSFIKESIHP